MTNITQSSWFLLLTVIATFLTIITGIFTVINFFSHLSRRFTTNSKPATRETSSALSRKNTPRKNAHSPRKENTIINLGFIGGGLIGAMTAIQQGYKGNWNAAEFTLYIALFIFFGMFLGGITAATPLTWISERRKAAARRIDREKRLSPLRKAVAATSGSSEARYNLARELHHLSIIYTKGREQTHLTKEALHQINLGLKSNPKSSSLYLLLGRILARAKQEREAKAAFEKVLQLGNDKFAIASARESLSALKNK